MITVTFFILIASLSVCGAVSDDYLDCMCEVESNCQSSSPCESEGCGYFQIRQSYYVACNQPTRNVGERLDHAWQRCANNMRCSRKCVNTYMSRHATKCQSGSANTVNARVHKGGPDGCTSFKAFDFANKVDDCLKKKKKLLF